MEPAVAPSGRSSIPDAAEHPPDPPARAPGVELVGALPGSGFVASQYLVKRDGQFVQLTELLFRTMEAIDGHQTFEQLANVMTSATEWALTPEQVRYLVVEKLAPLGLIASAGTKAPNGGRGGTPTAVGSGPSVERSAFMVQAPFNLFGPAPIERITRVTRYLFAPAVVVALLAAVAVAHAWLFLDHGIEYGLLEVLYSPGLLLAVLALVVVAALAHELGHASGLRHGGRQARSIGAGLYLVYPAFFTDVSEGYALSRAARLRTDLGGIYFHLLFAVALVALYQVTRWEFLLFTVLLIDIEALRQFLPFGRLDGYWILADLTGIPDPFSQMVPFVRGTAFGKRLEGTALPTLRPWVRRVFIAYIGLTLPAVALFIVFLLARLPILVGIVADVLRLQASQLATAAVNLEFVTILLAALQIGLVVLELVATGFILFKLAGAGAQGLRRLAQAGGRRRTGAWAIGALVIAVLALLWGPHVAGLADARGGDGVRYVDVASRSHVDGPVAYEQQPPVGGDHASVWQNCGFYASPVPAERAVHSMEHGAVWITYRPDSSAEEIAELRGLIDGRSHVLVSALTDNPSPIVASAWGRQLEVDDADDPRLEQFIVASRLGSNAPERGGPCEGGAGEPVAVP